MADAHRIVLVVTTLPGASRFRRAMPTRVLVPWLLELAMTVLDGLFPEDIPLA